MKRIKRFLTVSGLVLFCFQLDAQEPGYFGKTTFIEFGGQGQIPVLFGAINREKGFSDKNGTLHKSYNLKDFSFRAGIGTTTSENTGVGIEYVHHRYQMNPLRGGELNRQYTDNTGTLTAQYIRPEVAFLEIEERTILPKILFSSNSGRVPVGLTQEIGLGYCIIDIRNREPLVAFDTLGTITASSISAQLIDPQVEELKGMTFLYGMHMNFPVTRSFLISVGVRYNYSWLFHKKDFRAMEQTEYWLSGREIWSRLNQRRQYGILTFGIGGIICL